MLCEYGCGQEAKYQFKNGKWCCSENCRQCPGSRKRNSIRMKKLHKDPNSKYKSTLCNEKRSKKMKKLHKDPNSKYNSKSFRENQSIRMTGKNNPMFGVPAWNKNKTDIYSEEVLEKLRAPRTTKGKTYEEIYGEETAKKLKLQRSKDFSKIRKGMDPWNKNKINIYSEEVILKLKKPRVWTLKGLQKHHPEFFKIESPRELNGKIEVKCKFCNTWFIPTKSQLHERLRCIKNNFRNMNSFFYCSQECKNDCDDFNRKANPLTLKKFKIYSKKVYRYTNQTIKQYNIENIELRGREFGFDLDHNYSINDGFINKIKPKIIAHYVNLKIIPMKENRKKSINSSITIETLLENINNFNEKENRKELI
jgi:hypothetical protein